MDTASKMALRHRDYTHVYALATCAIIAAPLCAPLLYHLFIERPQIMIVPLIVIIVAALLITLAGEIVGWVTGGKN